MLLQYAVIAVAVLVSAWVVARKQFPGSMRKLRVALALPLLREGKPMWMLKLGFWISPVGKAEAAACGGCNSCEPKP